MWSQRLAWLSFVIFIVTFAAHRFAFIPSRFAQDLFGAAVLPTPVALKFFGAAVAGAVVSLVLGAAALAAIWKEGWLGAGAASAGVFISLLILAFPLWSLPSLLTLPRLNDVTTDIAAPPAFDHIAKIRQGQANPTHYRASFAALQEAAYPDIRTLVVPRPIGDVYAAVRETVAASKWKVLDEQAPEATKSGRIEAEDRTLIFGFVDDVVVRVTGSAKQSRVDIRSSSRFGEHDLGRNAQRIRRFLAEVKTRLTQMEQADRMEPDASVRGNAAKEPHSRSRRRQPL